MRTTFITLLLASAVTAIHAPAQAAPTNACETTYCASLPNTEERLELLAYLADQKGAKIAVSSVVCDTLVGSHRTGCAVLQGMVADARRAAVYSRLGKDWGPESRAAFSHLLVAEEAFAKAVGDNETDRMSPEAGADALAAQKAEKDAFLSTLKRIVGAKPRPALITFRTDFADADGALNAAYAQVMAVEDTSNLAWGSVEKSGIKRTQRAWLAYRDAFVTFARMRDATAADAVQTDLTTRRTVSLEGFLED